MTKASLWSRTWTSLRKRGLLGVADRIGVDGIASVRRRLVAFRDHRGSFQLEGNPRNSDVAIFVLAGYKQALWPLTLERLRKYAPYDADVCITTAGKRVPALADLCRQNGWTYLTTKDNKTGLVLNKAIAAHPQATQCFKLDEDIFISNGFFDEMIAGYAALVAEGIHNPGFCSPMINVNGVSYLSFLDGIGRRDAYRSLFGELRQAASGVRAHHDPEAAKWLWRHSLPLDAVAERIRTTSYAAPVESAKLIGSRFSIGAIYFERDFWASIGGFGSSWRQGILGVDESTLCAACIERSRPMFYLENVFAGHFSFYPQESAMMDALPEFEKLDPQTFSATQEISS